MDRHIGSSFQIPSGSLIVFFVGSILLTVPFYNCILAPLIRGLTGNPQGLTPLERITVGLVLPVLAMAATAITSHGHFHHSFKLFIQMQASSLLPKHNSYPCVLKSCVALHDRRLGESLHGSVVRLGLHYDLYTGNVLINMYSKLGSLWNDRQMFDALPESTLRRMRKVFDEMPLRDVVPWNTVIAGAAENELYEEAWRWLGSWVVSG